MKSFQGTLTLKTLPRGLAGAILCFFCASGPLGAQATIAEDIPAAASESGSSADHTITLTKVVEVYEFEDLKVAVDQYQVQRGDSLVKLLRQRGLLTSRSRAEEAKLLRLVQRLNPEVKNLSSISPGQILNVPLRPEETAADTAEAAEAAPETADPASTTHTVKIYERPQDSQQAARVVVMRHQQPGAVEPEASSPAAEAREVDADLKQAALAVDQASEAPVDGSAVGAEGTQTAAPAENLSFPSGNTGPLAMDTDNRVVYRTVRVRRGESLERLLRREGMHLDLIYGHLLKITMELNPEIKNADLIMAGTELKIPAAGEYLTALAGVNPQEVRQAALAISERRRPDGGGAGRRTEQAAVLSLPNEAVIAAKNTLGLIFTRLGNEVDSRGTLLIPASESGSEGGMEVDTSSFPVVTLKNGGRLVLDPGSRLSSAAVRTIRRLQPAYQVFRTGKNETLERALERLWPLCGFFRVYTKNMIYEGGEDIRLKISADWMVWTTEGAWNSGQPLVVNRAKSPDHRTSPIWTGFLEDHGIKVLDILQNQLLPAPETQAAPPELKVVDLTSFDNPTLLAAELVRNLGVEPRVGVQLDLALQPDQTVPPSLTAPVLWENGDARVVMDFGELPREAIQTLRENKYLVISSAKDTEAVIDGVLRGFGLRAQNSLTLTAPAGGPKMSLSIKGKLVRRGDGQYFITQVPLPSGLASLVEPNLKIMKY